MLIILLLVYEWVLLKKWLNEEPVTTIERHGIEYTILDMLRWKPNENEHVLNILAQRIMRVLLRFRSSTVQGTYSSERKYDGFEHLGAVSWQRIIKMESNNDPWH